MGLLKEWHPDQLSPKLLAGRYNLEAQQWPSTTTRWYSSQMTLRSTSATTRSSYLSATTSALSARQLWSSSMRCLTSFSSMLTSSSSTAACPETPSTPSTSSGTLEKEVSQNPSSQHQAHSSIEWRWFRQVAITRQKRSPLRNWPHGYWHMPDNNLTYAGFSLRRSGHYLNY